MCESSGLNTFNEDNGEGNSVPPEVSERCTPTKLAENYTSKSEENWEKAFAHAVKADDAEIPVHLWDNRVWRSWHNLDQRCEFEARYHRCPLITLRLT